MGKSRKKGNYVTASVHLAEEEAELLKKHAEEKEWSMSKIIRKAVRHYFGLEEKR